MRIRRRAHLVCRWSDGGLQVAVPGRRRWVVLDDELTGLLHRLATPLDMAEIASHYGGERGKRLRRAVGTLLALGILVDADGGDADAVSGSWSEWGIVTRRFHDESRDAFYLVDSDERRQVAEAIVAGGIGPPIFKDYSERPAVPLPRDLLPMPMTVAEAFAARRTCRAFTADPVSIDQLGTVLACTFGPQRFLDGGLFGVQQGRVSASAGGRHEVEAYVVAYAVAGLPTGLYHYAASRHALELLDERASRGRVAAMSFGQGPSFQGAFTLFTTAVAGRLAFKYRHPRAYRLWMYDAGHYAQTFALACTALGLGAFQTVAFTDSAVESFLGVDGVEEFAVYLLAAGVPAGFDPPVDPPAAPVPPAPLN
jgi:SagB-type dehydrogenase family enzyme